MLDHFVGLTLKELTFPIPNSSWGSKGSGQVFVSFEIIFFPQKWRKVIGKAQTFSGVLSNSR